MLRRAQLLLRQVVSLSVCLSVMLRYHDHIGLCWNFSKITSQLVSLQVLQTPTSRIYFTGTPLNFDWNSGGVWKFKKVAFDIQYKSSNISETGQDRTKVAVEDQ